jgi:hypothetical protein
MTRAISWHPVYSGRAAKKRVFVIYLPIPKTVRFANPHSRAFLKRAERFGPRRGVTMDMTLRIPWH